MLDLLTLDLKGAFRQEGCPLCHLRTKTEEHYIYSVLYEYVTDGGVRERFVNSLGYCRKHAWQKWLIEYEHWHDGLGTATMYESVLQQNLDGLETFMQMTRQESVRQHSRSRAALAWLRALLGRALSQVAVLSARAPARLPFGLVGRTRCRVCEQGEQTDRSFIRTFAEKLEWAQFRDWYRESEGLCMPHLNQVLSASDPEWRDFLVQVAVEKLAANAIALREALHRHESPLRAEPSGERERQGRRRAVAQLFGNPARTW